MAESLLDYLVGLTIWFIKNILVHTKKWSCGKKFVKFKFHYRGQ